MFSLLYRGRRRGIAASAVRPGLLDSDRVNLSSIMIFYDKVQ